MNKRPLKVVLQMTQEQAEALADALGEFLAHLYLSGRLPQVEEEATEAREVLPARRKSKGER